MKNIFLQFIIFLYIIPQFQTYYSFEFKRNITEKLTYKNLMKNLFTNKLIINLNIGTPSQKIATSIKLQSNPFYIFSSNVNDIYFQKFNPSLSSTYYTNFSKEITFNEEFIKGKWAWDTLTLENGEKINNFQFILASENNKKYFPYSGSIIGLYLNPSLGLSNVKFIEQFRKNNKIKCNCFSIVYEKEDSGIFYFGDYLHEIKPNKYIYDYFYSINTIQNNYKYEWGIEFDYIKVNERLIRFTKFEFLYPELGIIIGSYYYFEIINSTFFDNALKNKSCYTERFEINDYFERENYNNINDNYTYFICDKGKIDLKNFPVLTFKNKKLNVTYFLYGNDLFYEFENKLYFLIIISDKFKTNMLLGKPFFKKTNLVFDLEKKIIGTYSYIVINNSKIDMRLFFEILACLFFICILSIGLIYILRNKKRKKRANELIDNDYEYITNKGSNIF